MSITVKDLLANIAKLKEQYPDIEEWEIYTEQPNFLAPEGGISLEDAIKRINNCTYDISFNESEKCWCMKTSDGFVYFDTEEEARKCVAKIKRVEKHLCKEYEKTLKWKQKQEKYGWKIWCDGEGWVYLEIADPVCCHTIDIENKILTINNNY